MKKPKISHLGPIEAINEPIRVDRTAIPPKRAQRLLNVGYRGEKALETNFFIYSY